MVSKCALKSKKLRHINRFTLIICMPMSIFHCYVKVLKENKRRPTSGDLELRTSNSSGSSLKIRWKVRFSVPVSACNSSSVHLLSDSMNLSVTARDISFRTLTGHPERSRPQLVANPLCNADSHLARVLCGRKLFPTAFTNILWHYIAFLPRFMAIHTLL